RLRVLHLVAGTGRVFGLARRALRGAGPALRRHRHGTARGGDPRVPCRGLRRHRPRDRRRPRARPLPVPALWLHRAAAPAHGEEAGARRLMDFVLVHGAWHGAWCWSRITGALEAMGHRALAIDLPGLGDDPAPPESVSF